MDEIAKNFGLIDWGVVFLYMALTTWVGHLLRGQQATIKDFFLGGKSLPWWAVSGSIIATEISALTFIGVPGMVFALKGDWTYLQWGLGSIIARFIVGYYLVPIYYQREIFSPYDFMGHKLGESVKRLVTGLFSLGAILGQSVRVLVTAIILKAVTGMDMSYCILIIGAFALGWTLMGGMRTVIWTDVMQFCVFIVGGLFSLYWLWSELGTQQIIEMNRSVMVDGETIDKMRVFNFSTDPAVNFTFWVAIIAMPFQNLAAFGTDQLNAQRIFCCGTPGDARKAMLWSSVSQCITLMMLAVGSGLFAWYLIHEATPAEMALMEQDSSNAFPVWIVTVLPTGIKGLIVAGAFAAAVSSLDSILAALSQTTLSAYYGQKYIDEHGSDASIVRKSRALVVIWAVVLSGTSLLLSSNYYAEGGDRSLIGLAFRMVSYTYGPLLAILIIALFSNRLPWSRIGLVIGTVASVMLSAYMQVDIYNLADALGWDCFQQIKESRPEVSFAWFYPITTVLTVLVTVVFGVFKPSK
ncbi:sodium:solute symporter family transporter [Rubritalea marina]|uniref:sodium:solute symporter family transporter n=1 Tax=Rubritalea marina TaxID=361055 RepID=UPI000369C213|nr:sodium/solute symporter [Rubritalea marina]